MRMVIYAATFHAGLINQNRRRELVKGSTREQRSLLREALLSIVEAAPGKTRDSSTVTIGAKI